MVRTIDQWIDIMVGSEQINCGPIDQIVRIDELPEKSRPIDQLRQLINWAQHISQTNTRLNRCNFAS